MNNVCAHCGSSRGAHQVTSYACPSPSGFGPLRFKLKISRFNDDAHARAALADALPSTIETEIVRRTLKNFEDALGLFELRGPNWSTAEIMTALQTVREGYGI